MALVVWYFSNQTGCSSLMILNFPAVSVGLVGHVLISGWLVPNQWLLHGVVGYLTSGVLLYTSSVASAVASLVGGGRPRIVWRGSGVRRSELPIGRVFLVPNFHGA